MTQRVELYSRRKEILYAVDLPVTNITQGEAVSKAIASAIAEKVSLDGLHLKGYQGLSLTASACSLNRLRLEGVSFKKLVLDSVLLNSASIQDVIVDSGAFWNTRMDCSTLETVTFGEGTYRGIAFNGSHVLNVTFNSTPVNCSWANVTIKGLCLEGEQVTRAPFTISHLRWPVVITPQYMSIGCQRHSHRQWEQFMAQDIAEMDLAATAFWAENRGVLLAICASVAEKWQKSISLPDFSGL